MQDYPLWKTSQYTYNQFIKLIYFLHNNKKTVIRL